MRFKAMLLSGLILGAASASAQTTTTGTTTTETIGDRTPAENVRAGAVTLRAPGTLIDAARARHQGLRDNRLAYQHGDGSGTSLNSGGTSTTTGGTNTGSTSAGTGSLNNLIGSFLGGGGLSSLGGLLGGSTTGSTSSTGTSTSGIPSNITPEVLALLQQFGINVGDVFPGANSNANTTTSNGNSSSSSPTLIAPSNSTAKNAARSQVASSLQDRWPGKTDARSQTTTPPATETPSFRVRWSNAMLSTIFTGVTLGISTPQFQTLLKNNLRPFLRPELVNKNTSAKGLDAESVDAEIEADAGAEAVGDAE